MRRSDSRSERLWGTLVNQCRRLCHFFLLALGNVGSPAEASLDLNQYSSSPPTMLATRPSLVREPMAPKFVSFPSAPAPVAQVTVSVVIPCRNAAAWLPEQLEALMRQRFDEPWEILLVDNGSTDNSLAVARRFLSRLPQLRLIVATDGRGAGYARNVGVSFSHGRYLIFCDADDVVADDWVAVMVRALRQHPFVACRLEHRRLNPEWLQRSRHNVQDASLIPNQYLDVAGAGTLGIVRDRFLAAGGFDETMLTHEDHELCWRLQVSGTPLTFVPHAVIHYRHRQTLSGTLRQAVGYGYDKMVLIRRYRQLGHDIATKTWRGMALDNFKRLLRLPTAMRNKSDYALWLADFGYPFGMFFASITPMRLRPVQGLADFRARADEPELANLTASATTARAASAAASRPSLAQRAARKARHASDRLLDSIHLEQPRALRLPVLMYHKVGPISHSEWWVATSSLAAQIRALKAYGYQPVTFAEVMAFRAGKANPPAKPIVLTFDDGYRDILTDVLPLLTCADTAFKATVFVPTGHVGRDNRWDAGVDFTREPVAQHLSWDEIRECAQSGLIDIESHTVTHRALQQLDDAEVRRELVESRRALELQLRRSVRFFSYPFSNGANVPWIRQAVRRAGYTAAVGGDHQVEPDCRDRWNLRRIVVFGDTTLAFHPAAPDRFLFGEKMLGDAAVERVACRNTGIHLAIGASSSSDDARPIAVAVETVLDGALKAARPQLEFRQSTGTAAAPLRIAFSGDAQPLAAGANAWNWRGSLPALDLAAPLEARFVLGDRAECVRAFEGDWQAVEVIRA